jgi:aspartate kinase
MAADVQTVVMKFGGTSVADAERIRRAAARIVSAAESGRVVAVLSARGKTTDDLLAMAHEISDRPHPREMDMLLSTGERISCALAAMAINDLGREAISLTGSQAGIVTDASHTKARIIDVRADRIRAALDGGQIVLVAGFQGVSTDTSDVTTLGRGGSDTTAVALAAALDADVCEIYTDVSGVFSADPRIVPDARRLPVVSFEEMLEMAASGAGVLQLRSVEYARNHGIPIHCRSSFDDGRGTFVVGEDQTMERPLVTAVTHSTDEARVTLTGVPDRPGIAGRVLTALADANVNVDMIIQNEPESEGSMADMSFTVPRADLRAALDALEGIRADLGIASIASDGAMGKVSIVGAGMRSHPGVAAKTFSVLGDAGVNIEMISTSPIKISCVIREEQVADAVRELHTAFDLGADAVRHEDVAGDHRPVVRGAAGEEA